MTPAGTFMTSNERYSTSASGNFTSADDNDGQCSSSIDRLHALVSKPRTQDRYRHDIKLGQRRRDMTRKSYKYYVSSSGSLSIFYAITPNSTGWSVEGKGKLRP